MKRAWYIMIGGFLGAGKTTALARLAHYLSKKGLRVGLITNDQGQQLVDTAFLASQGFAVQEIGGGCFCCRFESLLEAAKHLTQATRPEVFIAEPVGSCTDLLATVSYPLRRIYGDQFKIAPLSVLIDPLRALRILGMESGPKFSSKVIYIYCKQLEEAEMIVINKSDLLSSEQLAKLRSALKERFPRAEVLQVSARSGQGLEQWFELLIQEAPAERAPMPLDYQTYGEGEALLGWLNAAIDCSAEMEFDPDLLLETLASSIHQGIKAAGGEVAHLKMTLDPGSPLGEIGVINLVANDYVPELSQKISGHVQKGSLIINLRAELAPDQMQRVVEEGLEQVKQLQFKPALLTKHLEAFRPGKPQPTHPVRRD